MKLIYVFLNVSLLLVSLREVAVANDVYWVFKKNSILLQDFLISHEERKSTSTMIFFDNIKMEGNPSFVISDNGVLDKRTSQTKEYFFKDFYKISKSKMDQSRNELSLTAVQPFNFFNVKDLDFVLLIENYQNGITTIVDHNIKYFSNSNPPSSISPAKFYEKDASEILNKDPKFISLITKYQNCIKAKDANCFININEGARFGIQQWTSLDGLCINGQDIDSIVYSKEVKNKISHTKILQPNWDFYEKFFNFSNDTSITYSNNIATKKETVLMELEGTKKKCEANENIRLRLERNEPAGEWKIVEIDTTVTFMP